MVWENRTEEDAHFVLVGREKVEGAGTPRVPSRVHLTAGRSAGFYLLKFPQIPNSAGGESFHIWALRNIQNPTFSRVYKNQTESQYPCRARGLIPQAAPERRFQ